MDAAVVELQAWFGRCSGSSLHPEYQLRLNALLVQPMTQELIDFLCDKATDVKLWPELRFEHLRILLLNESAWAFELKQWYLNGWKRGRLWLRVFFLRGYAMYATERELEPLMKRLCGLLEKNHNYEDYACILSRGGLPYLQDRYGYPCIRQACEAARREYGRIDPLLRGRWMLNGQLEHVNLVSAGTAVARELAFLTKNRG